MTTELSGKCGIGALDLTCSSKTDKPEATSERSRSHLTLKSEKDERLVQIRSLVATPFSPLQTHQGFISLLHKVV